MSNMHRSFAESPYSWDEFAANNSSDEEGLAFAAKELDAGAAAFADYWAPQYAWYHPADPNAANCGGKLWSALYGWYLEDFGLSSAPGRHDLSPVVEHEIQRELGLR